MDMITVKIKKMEDAEDLPLPGYMTGGAAGMDLYAALRYTALLRPGRRLLVPTGIKIALPAGYEGQVRPRSGLAAKYGITVLNSPGTIDSDYRGEIKVILVNLSRENFFIRRKDRIAQMVIHKIPPVQVEACTELPKTVRDEGGFGHTG